MDNYTPLNSVRIKGGSNKATTIFLLIANVAAVILAILLFLLIQQKL